MHRYSAEKVHTEFYQSHDTQLQLHLGRHGDQQHHQWEPNGSHHQIQIDSDVFRSTWKSTGDRFQLSYLCHPTWIPSGVFVVGPSALMVTFPWPCISSCQLICIDGAEPSQPITTCHGKCWVRYRDRSLLHKCCQGRRRYSAPWGVRVPNMKTLLCTI